MADKVQIIKEEIERMYKKAKSVDCFTSSVVETTLERLSDFIDSIPEEPGCEGDLTAKSENKNFEEIDRYCTLCMDINCFGCQYHDIHFRDVKL